MIERFFEHPYTLRYLRSGATGPHIDAFAVRLIEQGFVAGPARGLLRGVAHLGHWLQEQCIPLATLDEYVLATFRRHLSECRCGKRNKGRLNYCRSGSNRFLVWAREQELVSTPMPTEQIPLLIRDFETWMLRHRNVLPITLRECYRLQLRRFLEQVGDVPEHFDAAGIRRFILAQSQRTGRSRAKQAVTAVRMLLRYLAVRGLCAPELVDAVPTLAHWKLAALPTYLSHETIDQILASCDPATAAGRRDHAMLLLMIRLGLRAGDVAALRIADIDWAHATLKVFGKGRREAHLPLPQDVGDAIETWLVEGRPECDDDHVFLRLRAPYTPIHRGSVAGAAARTAERAAKRTGVQIPRVGSHILRHSAATALLREGMSLPAIGALLRHQRPDTTMIYAKVDVGLLGSLVRPWPAEVSS